MYKVKMAAMITLLGGIIVLYAGCGRNGTLAVQSDSAAVQSDSAVSNVRSAADWSDSALDSVDPVAGAVDFTAESVDKGAESVPLDVDSVASRKESHAESVAKNVENVEESEEPADSSVAASVDETAGSAAEAVGSVDSEKDINESFYVIEIPDEIFAKMQGKSYKDYCTVPREDLRYVHVLHKNLEGETLEGEMICHKIIAEDLLAIFRELYDRDYPIERMRLVDEYDADDETSMTDNNSSCFNFRTISHSTHISKHGLGVAVDINPLYNPYTKAVDGERIVEPAAGWPYLDRDADFPYKINEEDLCYQLFMERGYEWGGAWRSCKDYQHFELSDSRVDELRAKYEN